MSCGTGRRCGSGPTFLWLWQRLIPTALILPLAWEPLHAVGMALKRQKIKMWNPFWAAENLWDSLSQHLSSMHAAVSATVILWNTASLLLTYFLTGSWYLLMPSSSFPSLTLHSLPLEPQVRSLVSFVCLIVFSIAYKWDHTVLVFLFMTYFT